MDYKLSDRTLDLLCRLGDADWSSNLGRPPDSAVSVIQAKNEHDALRRCFSRRWENAIIDARNALIVELAVRDCNCHQSEAERKAC